LISIPLRSARKFGQFARNKSLTAERKNRKEGGHGPGLKCDFNQPKPTPRRSMQFSRCDFFAKGKRYGDCTGYSEMRRDQRFREINKGHFEQVALGLSGLNRHKFGDVIFGRVRIVPKPRGITEKVCAARAKNERPERRITDLSVYF
jgi:hypothetical protein